MTAAPPTSIATPENADRLAGFLREGKKALVCAPRRVGKTRLIRMISERVAVDAILTITYRTAATSETYYTGTFDPVTTTVNDDETVVFDEPWFMDKAVWKYVSQQGARLYIGTPIYVEHDETRIDERHFDKTQFDVVERLGFDDDSE